MTNGDGKARDDDRYNVPGLERGLRVLECFSRERSNITLADLARLLKLPRSTVFRLTTTLERLGYLQRDGGGRAYSLGSHVLTLGFQYLASMDLVEVARPHLTALRDATGASAHMAIRDGREIVYVARVPSRAQLTSNVHVGTRFQAHATSMGRMLLADLDDREISELYAGIELETFTDQTAGTLEALLKTIGEDRDRGYVVSRSAFERGVASVAAAVRDASGRTVAAINISSPDSSIDMAELEGSIKDYVLDCAGAISTWLGHRPAEIERIAI
jgi:DNA-binding IclR family transcriptional regulator